MTGKSQNKNFDGEKFSHPWSERKKDLVSLLKWQIFGDRKKWPAGKIINTSKPQFNLPLNNQQIAITFINHATVFLQHQGLNIITDPHWGKRASPVNFAGPARVRDPGAAINSLPGLDFVLVSHNHYDHLDIPTLKELNQLYSPRFLIAKGDAYLMEKAGITNFIEMDWWDEVDLGNGCRAVFVPVKHWSARGLYDRNKSLWGGFVILSSTQKIFFAGDTGYCDIFETLAQKYGAFNLCLLPVGAYEPRWFMQDSHMNPQEAVQTHLDLQSKKSIAIHFGLWQLTDEGIDQPITDLKKSLIDCNVSENDFLNLDVGETKVI